MSSAFSRLKQSAKETVGKGAKTEYPTDFLVDCGYAEQTKEFEDRILDRIKSHLSSLGEGSMTKVEAVAEPAQGLSRKLKQGTPFVNVLEQVYDAEKQVGVIQRQYQKQMEERVTSQIKKWIHLDYQEFKRERTKLEDRRKDMDAAICRQRKTDSAEVRERVSRATHAHTDQLNLVQNLLSKLPSAHKTHAEIFKTFLQLQKESHQKAAAAITQCLGKI